MGGKSSSSLFGQNYKPLSFVVCGTSAISPKPEGMEKITEWVVMGTTHSTTNSNSSCYPAAPVFMSPKWINPDRTVQIWDSMCSSIREIRDWSPIRKKNKKTDIGLQSTKDSDGHHEFSMLIDASVFSSFEAPKSKLRSGCLRHFSMRTSFRAAKHHGNLLEIEQFTLENWEDQLTWYFRWTFTWPCSNSCLTLLN